MTSLFYGHTAQLQKSFGPQVVWDLDSATLEEPIRPCGVTPSCSVSFGRLVVAGAFSSGQGQRASSALIHLMNPNPTKLNSLFFVCLFILLKCSRFHQFSPTVTSHLPLETWTRGLSCFLHSPFSYSVGSCSCCLSTYSRAPRSGKAYAGRNLMENIKEKKNVFDGLLI